MESDLGDLVEKEVNLILKKITDHHRLLSGSVMITPIGRMYERQIKNNNI